MVHVIHVNTTGDLLRLPQTFKRLYLKLPAMTRKEMNRWGHILERDVKNSAKIEKIKTNTGMMQGKGIEWRQGPRSNHGGLFMRREYIFLDSMSPHWVSVTRRRTRLLAWARRARSPKIRAKAIKVGRGDIKQFGIYVHKHPFILQGYNRARPKLRLLLKRAARKGVKV